MCISPLSIPNPNYGNLKDLSGKVRVAGDPMLLKDCTSKMISVPCGHCDECIKVKQMYLVQRVQMEALTNHVFFCTLTYNPESMRTLTTSQGYNIRYFDYRDLQNMFKRIRNDNAFGVPFRYLAVSERGTERARPHAHILFFIPKGKNDKYSRIMSLEQTLFDVVLKYWARNIGSDRKPVYKPCCTYIRKKIRGKWHSTYDLHYVYPTQDDPTGLNVAFYVLKYMLKGSNHDLSLQRALKLNYDDEEYRDTWKLVKSRSVSSKGFGLGDVKFSRNGLTPPSEEVIEYIRECVEISKLEKSFDYPCFFNVNTGQSFPLAPYYRNKGVFYKYTDALHFYFNSRLDSIDSPVVPEEKPTDKKYGFERYIHQSESIHKMAYELCDADMLDELFI